MLRGGKDGEGWGEIGRVKVGGGRRHSGGWRQWGCALRIYSRQHIHHGGFSWTRNALPWIYICFHPHHHFHPSLLSSPASHPNFDPILAGISRILTKPLFFNDFPTLFLDTTATSRAKGERSTFIVYDALFRARRRYGRVTYACEHTIFSLSIVGIVVKHLPIFSPPAIQRIDETCPPALGYASRFGNDWSAADDLRIVRAKTAAAFKTYATSLADIVPHRAFNR